METLTFKAKYKGVRCEFEITPVSGGNGTWHLFIDRYYKGGFNYRHGKWVFLPQKDDNFTPEQVAILEAQLQKHCPNP